MSETESKIVLVTGASGFLGSHIVSQLLAGGYRVRAAVRKSKFQQIAQNYASCGDRFVAVGITDISTDQFPSDVLKGVYAVIHSAAPIAEKATSSEEIVKGAIEGTLNVVRQAERAGIKRIVVTSTIATVSNPRRSFTDKDWNPITEKQTLNGLFETYEGAKTIAEQQLWAFADAHPNVDITTLNPPFLYGPFTKEFKLPTPNYYALSTNLYLYRLLTKDGIYPQSPEYAPLYADVRDAAAAHVRALTAPLSAEQPGIGRKRLIIGSIYPFDFDGFTKLLAEKRPELKDRLAVAAPPVFDLKQLPFDVERLEDVLGLKRADFKRFEETILDAVDSVMAVEKEWVENGFAIDIPQN